MANEKITPVILAGGKGTRLWPVSREDMPKQFCKLNEGLSLFQSTLVRVQNSSRFNRPVIVTGSSYVGTVRQQLKELSIEAEAIISEPVGKDTSAAVLLAVEVAAENELFLVMPSDHLIAEEGKFFDAVDAAAQSARLDGLIVTFGIKPTHPDTGFGYLRAGKPYYNRPVSQLENFVEKPDLETAMELVKQPDIFWNAGIFLFDPKTVRAEFEKRASGVFSSVVMSVNFGQWAEEVFTPEADLFNTCPAISFDYAIMEKTNRAATIPVDPKWSDLGSATAHPGEDRPWGRFDSLDRGNEHQVKRIRVDPAQRLSLQYHHHRAEHWVVVSGIATVTVDDAVVDLSVGEQIFIPQGAVHRLDNFSDETVEIIEVQIGSYLGEDDIVRVEDIYGREPIPAALIEDAA